MTTLDLGYLYDVMGLEDTMKMSCMDVQIAHVIMHMWLLLFLIAGIYPQASSKGGAHGYQSDDSTYLARTWEICAVVFTSPLTSRLCSQLQELQRLSTRGP